jgi:hypothetical protein
MTTYVATGRDPKANKAFWEAATLLLILLLVLLVSLCGLRGWLKSPIRRSVADPVDSRVRRDRRPDPVVQQRDGSAGEDVPEYEEPPSDGRETDYETGWGNGRGRSDDDTDDETRKPDVRIRYPDYNVDVKNLPQEGGWGLHLDQERSGSQQGRQRALRPTHGAAPYDADLFGDYEQSASPQKRAFDLETQPLRAIEEQGTMPNFDELNLRRSSEVREEVFSPVLLRTETTSPSKPPVSLCAGSMLIRL